MKNVFPLWSNKTANSNIRKLSKPRKATGMPIIGGNNEYLLWFTASQFNDGEMLQKDDWPGE